MALTATHKISIVTAVYNGEKTLENLIQSIITQDDTNYEFILIDGNSSDGTKELILKYQDYISYWSSEPDRGIYDAWNKGITKATGDWIMFLGCDDILLPGALKAYHDFIAQSENVSAVDLISSRLEMMDLDGNVIRVAGWPWAWPKYLREVTIAHPGALHSAGFFKKYGLYDIKYKIVGDFELIIRAREKLQALFMNKITVRMSEGGASDSVKAILEHYKAATTTGGYSKNKGMINALIVISKLKIKRIARSLGLNLYLKR